MSFYTTDAFKTEGNNGPEWRTMHLGTDYWLEARAEVMSVAKGTVISIQNNALDGDYGPTLLGHDGNFPGVASVDQRDVWLSMCPPISAEEARDVVDPEEQKNKILSRRRSDMSILESCRQVLSKWQSSIQIQDIYTKTY